MDRRLLDNFEQHHSAGVAQPMEYIIMDVTAVSDSDDDDDNNNSLPAHTGPSLICVAATECNSDSDDGECQVVGVIQVADEGACVA